MKGNTTTATAERFVGKPELRERYGLDPATILRKVRDGLFPSPVYVFGRARWRLDEIQAWESANLRNDPPAKSANLRNAKVKP